jgi:biotin carboxylase
MNEINLKNSSILFLGLGDLDIDHIKVAKEMGWHTIATNRDPSALALQVCDFSICIDGNDVNGIILALKRSDYRLNIQDVYTGTELFLSRSILMSLLGIKSNTLLADYSGQDKLLMKSLFIDHGVSTPRHWRVTTTEQASRIMNDNEIEVVIKPPDSLSSAGVSVVCDSSELTKAMQNAKAESKGEEIIVEEYIRGNLHDVNAYWYDGHCYPCGMADKYAPKPPFTYSDWSRVPTQLDEKNQQAIYKLLENATRAAGMVHGPVKGDFILSETGTLYVIEIAPRFHGPVGTIISFPVVYGLKPMELYLAAVKGSEPKFINWNATINNLVETRSINLEPGKLTKLSGLDEVSNRECVLLVNSKLKIGDQITARTNNNNAHIRITYYGKNHDDLERNWKEIVADLEIKVQA